MASPGHSPRRCGRDQFVVCIIDEAVSPVVLSGSGTPNLGSTYFRNWRPSWTVCKASARVSRAGLQCADSAHQPGGKHLSQCGPVGRAEWGSLQGRGRPHAPMGVTGVPPLERLDPTNLPLSYPSLFGLQTPHREAASWGVPLHGAWAASPDTKVPASAKHASRPSTETLGVTPEWGGPPAREPCLPLPHWPVAGAPDCAVRTPSTGQGTHGRRFQAG